MEDNTMLEVTESALNNVRDYLRQQKIETAIRITMSSGGCTRPSLVLAADETQKNDKTFNHEGLNFVVDKELLASCEAIKVDFIETSADACGCGSSGGFSVTSKKPLPVSDQGCGCSCSSGSCG